MNAQEPWVLITICIAAFVGGYAVVSKVIDMARGNNRETFSPPPGHAESGPRPGSQSSDWTSPSDTVPAVLALLRACGHVAATRPPLSQPGAAAMRRLVDRLGCREQVKRAEAERAVVTGSPTEEAFDADIATFYRAYQDRSDALNAGTLALMDFAALDDAYAERKSELLTRAAGLFGTLHLIAGPDERDGEDS